MIQAISDLSFIQDKFVQPDVNTTSPYLNHLTSTQVEISPIVSSSQHASLQSQVNDRPC